MNEFFQKHKQLIAISVLLVIIVGVGMFVLRASSKKSTTLEQTTEEAGLPETELLPTIDNSVLVSLEPDSLKREVTLSIANIPSNITNIEYELSYLAKGDLPKGVIGTIELKGERKIERDITLGTCSSGACIYDEGVNNVKVSLKFNGESGSKIFEKEFEI